MWVRFCMASPEEVRRYSDEGGSWRWRIPTWRGMALHGKARMNVVGRTNGKVRVESSREPFMDPSGHALGKNIGRGEVIGINIPFVGLLQGKHRSRVVHKQLERVAKLRMSGCISTSMEDSRDDCNCSRYEGGSYGGSSKEEEKFSLLLGEDDD